MKKDYHPLRKKWYLVDSDIRVHLFVFIALFTSVFAYYFYSSMTDNDCETFDSESCETKDNREIEEL